MRKVLGVLLLVVIGLVGTGPAALAVTPVDIVVEDRAGVLDQNTLLPAVQAIEFYQPTKVAVYTYNGSAVGQPQRGGPAVCPGRAPGVDQRGRAEMGGRALHLCPGPGGPACGDVHG